MGTELIALATGGTDTALWMRQKLYSVFGWAHIEFRDMDEFVDGVRQHTGVALPTLGPRHLPGVLGAMYPAAGRPNNNTRLVVRGEVQRLKALTILTHGTFNGPYMGAGESDCLTRGCIAGRRQTLGLTRACFEPNASVVFGGCLVGLNPWLLADLSRIWVGVRVTGLTDTQKFLNPIYSGGRVTLRNGILIEGSETSSGKAYLKNPHQPLHKKEIKEEMGGDSHHDSDD